MSSNDIDMHLRGLDESASTIDGMIATGSRDDMARQIVTANVRHIGIMCNREDIIASGADLSAVKAAQLRGINWLEG